MHEDIKSKFKEIDLLISRVQRESPGLAAFSKAAGPQPLRASTVSTVCCSICVSTISTIHPDQAFVDEDPEAAKALATLYDRAIATVGEPGIEQLLKQFGKDVQPDGVTKFFSEVAKTERKK